MSQNISIIDALGGDKPLLCSWMMMPGGFQAGAFAAGGLDGDLASVLIDMQHGLIGYRDMVEMVQAINAAGSFAIVRPPVDNYAMVSRALDAGAAGIVWPMINSVDDAKRLVDVAKFAPIGQRSWGAYLGQSQMGLSKEEYLASANSLNAVFAMIETQAAMDNLDDICAVEGLDGVFVGPNDLSISLTKGKAADINHPLVQEALPKIVSAARSAGIFAGLYVGNSADVKKYADMGFCLMPALTDVAFIKSGAATVLGEVGE